MRRFTAILSLFASFAFAGPTLQQSFNSRVEASVEDLKIELPPGWVLHQDAIDNGKIVLGFAKGDESVNIFVTEGSWQSAGDYFTSEAVKANSGWSEKRNGLSWDMSVARRDLPEAAGGGSVHVAAFSTVMNGKHYFGFARGGSEGKAKDNAFAFLDRLAMKSAGRVSTRSLTGHDYTGKKYYLGWGAAGAGDPSMMQNEVKYDVLHTHDIFTKEIGGNYIGTSMIGYQNVSSSKIRAEWKRIGEAMTWNDMYVQYSSGHGSQSGLGVGVSYTEMRDAVLSYPAKEAIVLVMACYSGNLVNSFNQKKSMWQDYQANGRTLFVMTSSTADTTSSTGPGKDPQEPGGPTGSAGSAFGHALWKALIGNGDGFVDGVKDGYLSLDEILKYTIKRTKEVGGHTPVSTGAYQPTLIMNRVPSADFLARLEGSTENLSDQEIATKVEELDKMFRL